MQRHTIDISLRDVYKKICRILKSNQTLAMNKHFLFFIFSLFSKQSKSENVVYVFSGYKNIIFLHTYRNGFYTYNAYRFFFFLKMSFFYIYIYTCIIQSFYDNGFFFLIIITTVVVACVFQDDITIVVVYYTKKFYSTYMARRYNKSVVRIILSPAFTYEYNTTPIACVFFRGDTQKNLSEKKKNRRPITQRYRFCFIFMEFRFVNPVAMIA